VPVTGIISDGEETRWSAVTCVFPNLPRQRCQFHSLKDAVKPFSEADRYATTFVKKQLRGVRPLERALEERPTPDNDALENSCLAVRASLTGDGRSLLKAARLGRIQPHHTPQRLDWASAGKKSLPLASKQVYQLLTKGLQATAALWPLIEHASTGKSDPGQPEQNSGQYM
jgi:hypothetical protein